MSDGNGIAWLCSATEGHGTARLGVAAEKQGFALT